ncbi:MAG TPA: type VII secretion target [Pseudonocardiaceae bacterium]|jgi:hypothetical protein|nr:type VII secretion target [Pseudonocardiaceae bacterium]
MQVDPGGGSGFGVDPAQLKGVAGQLGKAYDDVNTAITDFSGSECLDAAVFGDFGMGPAWSAFDSAWASELSVTGAAISELITKVSTTADNYRNTDDRIAAGFTAAGPR